LRKPNLAFGQIQSIVNFIQEELVAGISDVMEVARGKPARQSARKVLAETQSLTGFSLTLMANLPCEQARRCNAISPED
jgi:hypothetical protein